MQTLCGIDEAGRGPLAGPLVIAGVILQKPIEGVTDSKKLSVKKRESLYHRIIETAQWHIALFDAHTIDEKGLSASLVAGIEEIMKNLDADDYLFDGHTTLGVEGLRCKVKADLDIPAVSAASIVAKVTRDRIMMELSEKYPFYGFETHKGYGTKAHIAAIREFGYTPIHRMSFKVKSLLQPSFF